MRHPLLLLIIFLAAQPAAWGAGIWLYERGTPEVGTANAGVMARAGDASTALSNPAGIMRLSGGQWMASLQPMILNIRFRPDERTTTTGPDGNADAVLPAMGFYYAKPVNDRWGFGFSLSSYFGLGVKYEDDWVGRYFLQEGQLLTLSATPSVGFKVNDWLSVGGGVALQTARQKTRAAVNNILPGQPDGSLEFKDTSLAVGGLVSALITASDRTRLGIGYTTPVTHDFRDTPQFSGLAPGLEAALQRAGVLGAEIGLEMTLPQSVMFSVYHEMNDTVTLLGNVGWQDWSRFGQIPVSVNDPDNPALTQDRNYSDTAHLAAGAHFRVKPRVKLTAGFAYDTSPAEDADRTVDLPLDRGFRYSGGLIWEKSDRLTVGLAYTLLDAGPAAIEQRRGVLTGTLAGAYSSNFVHVISLSLNVR